MAAVISENLPNAIFMPEIPHNNAILRTFGAENIAILIADGLSYAKIARALGLNSGGAVAAFIYNLPPPQRAVIAAAYSVSAEQLLDQAGEILDEPEPNPRIPITSAQVALRAHRATHLMRHAGIRNARYRTQGPGGGGGETPATPTTFHFHLEVAPPPQFLPKPVIEHETTE